jgi:hypothetical protein
MDDHHFDHVIRTLAGGANRRGVLRGLAGGVALAAAGLTGLGGTEAKGRCKAPKSTACGKGKNAYCADTASDVNNCGGCGIVCPSNTNCTSYSCSSGSCVGIPTGNCAAPNGELDTSDPTFSHCDGYGGSYFYDAYTYEHAGGPLSINLQGSSTGSGTLSDTYLSLYSSFDPSAPCDGIVAANDDYCGVDSYIALSDLAAGTYTVVATSFNPDTTGSYALSYNTPAPC